MRQTNQAKRATNYDRYGSINGQKQSFRLNSLDLALFVKVTNNACQPNPG